MVSITVWYIVYWVYGKLNHHAKKKYVEMRTLNLALHGVHTHSKGACGVHNIEAQ
jgi:hypothetical protein